jgi:hypothetical protein
VLICCLLKVETKRQAANTEADTASNIATDTAANKTATTGGLSVGFAAVFYGENFDGIAGIVEADAVVADTEAELWRVDSLKTFYIAFAAGNHASHGVQDAESCGLLDGAELGLGPVVPDNFLKHGYWPAP